MNAFLEWLMIMLATRIQIYPSRWESLPGSTRTWRAWHVTLGSGSKQDYHFFKKNWLATSLSQKYEISIMYSRYFTACGLIILDIWHNSAKIWRPCYNPWYLAYFWQNTWALWKYLIFDIFPPRYGGLVMDSDFLVLDSLLALNGSFVAMQVQVVLRLPFKKVKSTKPCLSSFCRKRDSECVMKLTYFHQYSVRSPQVLIIPCLGCWLWWLQFGAVYMCKAFSENLICRVSPLKVGSVLLSSNWQGDTYLVDWLLWLRFSVVFHDKYQWEIRKKNSREICYTNLDAALS